MAAGVIPGSKPCSPGSARSRCQTWILWTVRPLQLAPHSGGQFLWRLPVYAAQREPIGPGKHRLQIEIVGQAVIRRQFERQKPRPRKGEPKPGPPPRKLILDRLLGADLAGEEQEIGHDRSLWEPPSRDKRPNTRLVEMAVGYRRLRQAQTSSDTRPAAANHSVDGSGTAAATLRCLL